MPSPGQLRSTSRPRRVRLVLRDGVEIEGSVFLGAGHALAPYLSSRKSGWVNLVNARWLDANDELAHAVIQLRQVALAIPLEDDLPVLNSSAALQKRPVELHLIDGRRLQAHLHLGDRQRLSDYLHAIGQFIPCTDAAFPEDEWPIGSAVISASAIRLIHDLTGIPEGGYEEDEDAMGFTMGRPSGRFAAITPGHPEPPPPRRTTMSMPIVPFAVATSRPYKEAVSAMAAQVANHWLSKLAARYNMRPADARLVRDVTTEEIWNALLEANGVADATLAMNVAAALRLPLAPLAEAEAATVALVPSKVARRHNILPLSVTARGIRIATSDPSDLEAEQSIAALIKAPVLWEFAPPGAIREAINVRYPPDRPSRASAPGFRPPFA